MTHSNAQIPTPESARWEERLLCQHLSPFLKHSACTQHTTATYMASSLAGRWARLLKHTGPPLFTGLGQCIPNPSRTSTERVMNTIRPTCAGIHIAPCWPSQGPHSQADRQKSNRPLPFTPTPPSPKANTKTHASSLDLEPVQTWIAETLKPATHTLRARTSSTLQHEPRMARWQY